MARCLAALTASVLYSGYVLHTPASAADSPDYFSHQEISRQVTLHEPRDIPPGPAPLVIALHGSQQTTRSLRQWINLDAVAARHKFRVAYATLVITMVPLALNMPPTPWTIEISAPGTWAGAVPRICRTPSCSAYMPYMPECI